MSTTHIFLLLISSLLPPSSPFPSGAPPSQCASLTPSHNAEPQSSPSPYKIEVSPEEIQGGQSTRIKLTAQPGSTFTGFIILAQPHSKNGYGETQKSYGGFKLIDDQVQLLRCHKVKDSGATHKSSEKKNAIEVEWVAPLEGGEYVILASIVRDFSTYWIRQPSAVIRVKRNGAAAPDASQSGNISSDNKSPISSAASSKAEEYYTGCGESKGCFGLPAGCISAKSCDVFTTFEKRGQDHFFQIGGRIDEGQGYVASGLSFDDKMADSSIVSCVMNGGRVEYSSFYSRGWTLQKTEATFTNPSYVYEEGFFICEFIRTPHVSVDNGLEFNLEEDEYHLLLARGNQGTGEMLAQHTARAPSRSTTRLDSVEVLDEDEEDQLKSRYYTGCGESKTCYGVPTGCWQTWDCLLLVTINSDLEFQLTGSLNSEQGYVAVGMSENGEMGPASVTACVLHPSVDLIIPRSYYNIIPDEHSRYSSRMVNESAGIIDHEPGTFINGNLYCEFKRSEKLVVEELEMEFDFAKEYHLLLARSVIGAPELLGQHESSPVHRAASPYPISLKSSNYTTFDPDPLSMEELLNYYYDGCDSTRGCFLSPKKDCLGKRNCEMLISFNEDLEFRILGRSSGYVATGLSFDDKMGQDLVTGCYLSSAGVARVGSYYNVIDGKLNQGFSDTNKGIVPGSGQATHLDGWLFCEFKRTPILEGEELGRVFNLEKDEYHILLSRGEAADVGYLSKHPTPSDRASTPNAVHLSHIGILGPKSNILIELHASFMILAWLLLASTGMFTARYYKQTHTSINPLNKAFWFVVHLSCMATTVLLSLSGAVLIFIEIGGYSKGLEGAGAWHPVLGIILSGLALCQVGIAFLRPHPGTPRRPLFNWVHWSIGNGAHIIGIACLFLAESLSKSGVHKEKSYLYVLVGFVIFHVAMHVVMSIHTVWADKQMDINRHNRMRAVHPGPMKPSGKSEEAPGTSLRTALLTVYVLVAGGVAITLVVIVTRKL